MTDDQNQYLPDGRYRDRDGRWFNRDGTPLQPDPPPTKKIVNRIGLDQPTGEYQQPRKY